MISRIQAVHYRCFHQLDVSLQCYAVLAGANGSGKSALLDILQLFADILSRGLISAFLEPSPDFAAFPPRTQRLGDLIHYQRGNDFGLALEAKLPEHVVALVIAGATVQEDARRWPHTLRYEVRFDLTNRQELQILEEFLWLIPRDAFQRDQGRQIGDPYPHAWQPVITRKSGRLQEERSVHLDSEIVSEQGCGASAVLLSPNMLALASVPCNPSLSPATHWFIEMLTRGVLRYAPDTRNMRGACPAGQPATIRADAVNLPWVILSLKQEHPSIFEAWVEHVRTALPALTTIDAIRCENDSCASLNVGSHRGETLSSSGLSVGTLSLLAYAILPYLPTPPALVCLEEPENDIHPRAIEAMLQSLRSLYTSQVWISTHSPVVLAHTNLDDLIIMEDDGHGGIEAVPGHQHPCLRDWSGGIDLGSLFAAGVFG